MDRRTFLKATGVCAATTATANTALAQTAVSTTGAGSPPKIDPNTQSAQSLNAPTLKKNLLELSLTTPYPDNLSGASDQLHQLVQNLKSASNDRIRISINSAADSKPNAHSQPEADLYYGPLHALENTHPATTYFSGLPHEGGLGAPNVESWVASGGGGALLDELGDEIGYKPLLAGHLGENPGLWSNMQIRSMADLHGRTVAITGASAQVLKAFGAHPVKIAPEQLKTALSNGTIDVAECGSFHTAMSMRLHESARHVANGRFNPSGTTIALAINSDRWHDISAADKALFAACTSQAYRMSLTDNRTLETCLSIALKTQHRVKHQILTADANLTWERIADTFLAHVSSSSDLAKRTNASYMAFKNLTA